MNRHKNKIPREAGFTLIEILIALTLISALSAIIYVNINPTARFEEARNQQRITDIHDIMQAIMLYKSDNGNQLPPELDGMARSLYYQIGTGNDCAIPCENPLIPLQDECIDLGLLASGGFIPQIPSDPILDSENTEKTAYYISIDHNDTITIGSCDEEKGTDQSTKPILISK